MFLLVFTFYFCLSSSFICSLILRLLLGLESYFKLYHVPEKVLSCISKLIIVTNDFIYGLLCLHFWVAMLELEVNGILVSRRGLGMGMIAR